jgi:hypothetical protein
MTKRLAVQVRSDLRFDALGLRVSEFDACANAKARRIRDVSRSEGFTLLFA